MIFSMALESANRSLTPNELLLPQPTEWQRIGNQIDAAMIFARADFVSVHYASHHSGARFAAPPWLGVICRVPSCVLIASHDG
jgi:hypothetical protein